MTIKGREHGSHRSSPAPREVRVEDLLAQVEDLGARLASVQEELTRSRRLATLGTLAAFIAHEFNNILTPILSYAQLAQAHPEDKDLVRKALARAATGAEKASRIAQTILALSRTEPAQGAESGQSAADVKGIVSESLVTLWLDPSVKSIKVVSEVEDGLLVGMAPVALQQVLTNLLANSCKAISGKTGRISIRASRSTGNTEQATIEVEDDGPGIRSDILPRLFLPFVTTADPRKPTEGTGLGLTICQRLVEEVGGTIRAESESGSGAKFVITLPIAKAAPVAKRAAKIKAA